MLLSILFMDLPSFTDSQAQCARVGNFFSSRCAYCYAYRSSFPDRKFFGFPKNEDMCKKWIAACNRPYLLSKTVDNLHKNYKICSLHFSKSDFATYKKCRLKKSALPRFDSNASPSSQSRSNNLLVEIKEKLNEKLQNKKAGPVSTSILTSSEFESRNTLASMKQNLSGKLRSRMIVSNSLDELDTLKRMHPEEKGIGFAGSMKLLHPSDELDTLKRIHPEEKGIEFAGSTMKLLYPSGDDTLLRDIKDEHTCVEDTDVTIKVKDHEFRAHKSILRAKSPVFFKMLSQNFYEKKNGIINITDCEPDAFQEFLNYLYSKKLDNVPMDIVCNLYYIGDKYRVGEIKKICVTSISRYLSIETFCEIVTFAQLYKESTILERASEFFIRNIKTIIVTDKWLSFLREYPMIANELHIKAAEYFTNADMRA